MKADMFLPFVFALFVACSNGQVATKRPEVNSSVSAVNKTVLLRLVNELRSTGCQCGKIWYYPTEAVSWNEQLESAAIAHSKDMYKNKYLKHIAADGSSAGDRIVKAGYKWKLYGENIASGQKTEEDVISSWIKSPGHCANLMYKYYKEIGVARVGDYWTMDLAVK